MSRLEQARKKLRSRYLARLPVSIAALRAAIANPEPDLHALGGIAHRLRGSGGTYGFDEITLFATTLQDASPDTVRFHAAELIALLEQLAHGDLGETHAPTSDGSHVLTAVVVEDDPNMAELVIAVCGMMGFSSLSVGTIAQAQQVLHARAPDLVVLDMVLPDGTGLDVLRSLRSQASPAVVVALTMLDDPSVIQRAEELGLHAYLQKPLDVGEFCDVVRGLVPAATVVK